MRNDCVAVCTKFKQVFRRAAAFPDFGTGWAIRRMKRRLGLFKIMRNNHQLTIEDITHGRF